MIFNFPDVGEGIHEGTVVNWLVNEGDIIHEDQAIVEVETDKAVVEIPSPTKGVLVKKFYQVSEIAIVHTPLCEIKTEITESFENKTSENSGNEDSGNVVGSLEDADSAPIHEFENLTLNNPDINNTTQNNIKTLPKIRNLAKQHSIDLTTVNGTGPNGTITEADIMQIINNQTNSSSNTPNITEDETKTPLTTTRIKIAENMRKSVTNSVSVTHFDEIIANKLIQTRQEMNKQASYLSLIIEQIIKLLPTNKKLISRYNQQEQTLYTKDYINMGIAVDTEHGLIVPVIKHIEKMSSIEITNKIKELAEKAKMRKLTVEETKNHNITITNYGSIGGIYATPILNPPNLVNIGIGKFTTKLVKQDDKIIEQTLIPVSITYDHQIIDGAEIARFVNSLKEQIE